GGSVVGFVLQHHGQAAGGSVFFAHHVGVVAPAPQHWVGVVAGVVVGPGGDAEQCSGVVAVVDGEHVVDVFTFGMLSLSGFGPVATPFWCVQYCDVVGVGGEHVLGLGEGVVVFGFTELPFDQAPDEDRQDQDEDRPPQGASSGEQYGDGHREPDHPGGGDGVVPVRQG